VNRPLLATSLRCTDAIATLAFLAETGLQMHVVLFDALSLH